MQLNIKSRFYKLYGSSWFITLFATTLGVLLAFYLNDLSARSKIEDRKQFSIQNLDKELSINKSILLESEQNDRLIDFLSAIRKIDPGFSNELNTSVNSMNALMKDYFGFMEIRDSTYIEPNIFQYDVAYKFVLDLDDLQYIAWETSKMSNITHELDYNCLQILVKIYSLQDIYTKEQQKILDHFVNADHSKLLSTMSIVQQFKLQLLDAISEGQNQIKNCD